MGEGGVRVRVRSGGCRRGGGSEALSQAVAHPNKPRPL